MIIEKCRPYRAGQSQWHAFEILADSVQLQMLESAATAIELARVGSEEPVNYWRKAAEAIEEAVLDARNNPETARLLFRLAAYGRNDPASLSNCERYLL